MAKYESIQAILEEAGMSHQQLAEVPYGLANGTNKAFTTTHKPLSDTNYDDTVDASDVLVLVNGSPAEVATVNASNGVITLKNAPAVDAQMLIDYRYTATPMHTIEQLRSEAQQWVDDAMKQAGDCAPYDVDFADSTKQPHPTIRAITRYYAAAQLLIRDYGYNQDTELTSKDGFKKLALIIGDKNDVGMLARFIAQGGVCGGTGDTAAMDSIASSSDGDMFGPFIDHERVESDDCW